MFHPFISVGFIASVSCIGNGGNNFFKIPMQEQIRFYIFSTLTFVDIAMKHFCFRSEVSKYPCNSVVETYSPCDDKITFLYSEVGIFHSMHAKPLKEQRIIVLHGADAQYGGDNRNIFTVSKGS